MPRRAGHAVFMLLLLGATLAQSAVAAPTAQIGHGPGRAGTLDIAAPLDFVAAGTYLPEGRSITGDYSLLPAWTGTHWIGAYSASPGCAVATWQDLGAPPTVIADTCGRVVAVDGGDAFICRDAGGPTAPVLTVLDATTGDLRWTYASSGAANSLAICNGVAVSDERVAVPIVVPPGAVAYQTGVESRLALLDRSGSRLWERAIPSFVMADPGTAGPLVSQVQPGGPTVIAAMATLLPTGIIVTARQSCPCGLEQGFLQDSMRTVSWFDLAGTYRGAAAAISPLDDAEALPTGHQYWAGDDVAAGILGRRIVVINPLGTEPARQTKWVSNEPPTGFVNLPSGPVATEDRFVLPGRSSVTAVHEVTLETQWSWAAPAGWTLNDLFATKDHVWAVLDQGDIRAMLVVRLNLETGALEQRMVWQWDAGRSDGDEIRFAPGPNGSVYVLDSIGRFVQMAPAAEPLPVDLPRYPAPGAAVVLDPAQFPGAVNITVHWGEGSVGDLSHRYDQPGRYRVEVQVQYDDQSTRSGQVVLDVGGSPDQLTWLQQRFASDNVDTTWGVLGLVLGALGAAFGWGARTLRRRAMAARMQAVEAAAAGSDAAALDGIARARRDLHAELLAGRIGEGMFTVVDAHATRLARRRIRHLLAGLGDVPHPVHAALEAVLEDGVVTTDEWHDLQRFAKRQGMDLDRLEAIRSLLPAAGRPARGDVAD